MHTSLEFSHETREGGDERRYDPPLQRQWEAAGLSIERLGLAKIISRQATAEDFDEEDSRRFIGDLQVIEDFQDSGIANMDMPKRDRLVRRVSDLQYQRDSILYAA
ncbi:unnamed protein product [Strongylus vulgaris]|uniref:Uncharacterized protein n=1 Tax=Strongylus vulgaris TaxID=40348 RepID=A0A3P7K2I8_STRVU|nr:unnamed protein product [Strongylus vulgaris]